MSSDTDPAFPSPEWITSGPCEKCGHVTFRKPSSYAPGQVAEAAEKRLGLASPSNAYAETARRIESEGCARPRDNRLSPLETRVAEDAALQTAIIELSKLKDDDG